MGRFAAMVGLALSAWSVAPSAYAHGTVCTEPSPASSKEAARDAEETLLDAELELAAALPLGEDDLPWCASPEDPRCSPLPGHTTPSAYALRGSAALQSALTAVPAGVGVGAKAFASFGLPPAAGVAHRLERPPRSTRRRAQS